MGFPAHETANTDANSRSIADDLPACYPILHITPPSPLPTAMMSITIANPETTVPPQYPQPFHCHVCQKRFTRHENLKRHAAVHTRSADKATFTCEFCQISFSRLDLRHRHMKRKHPDRIETRDRQARKKQPQSAGPAEQEGGTPSQERAHSVSSSDASFGLQQPQQSLDEFERDIDIWIGQMGLPQPQRQPQHDDLMQHSAVSRASLSTRAPPPDIEEEDMQSVGNWLSQQSSAMQPGVIQPRQKDLSQIDEMLLLHPSSLGSSLDYHFSNDLQLTADSRPDYTGGSPADVWPRTAIPDGLSSKDVSFVQDNWFPSASQTARGYHLYFTHVSHFIPFIHRPTFDATEISPHLGLGMLCLAYQHGEDPDCNEQVGSGVMLSLRCFHRARALAALEEEITGDSLHKITLVQTYWLLQVCSMMYLCGEDSIYGLKIHSRMISLARFGGLTQAIPIESEATEDLDLLWRDFIRAESHKRTLLAVHQIDALWYQLFSIPRSLSHLEIKHDLPCREEYWTASSPGQWAHRQLAAKQSPPLIPYSTAVRLFLSPDFQIETLPIFDLYGAINIAQFLLSSAREVSGWSTMSGRFSIERFEPLRSSLLALERLIRPGKTVKSTHAVSCEATWELAMIELLVWSASHTCGIVEGSVDKFLTQSTYLASSCKIVNETATVSALQPHVDWFLQYLDTSHLENSEPPWITLYAYKAFLIAWQLLHEGIPGAMKVVGIRDGDLPGAVAWARKVFQRGQQKQLSKFISTSLDLLEK